jgi:hypothetical protein
MSLAGSALEPLVTAQRFSTASGRPSSVTLFNVRLPCLWSTMPSRPSSVLWVVRQQIGMTELRLEFVLVAAHQTHARFLKAALQQCVEATLCKRAVDHVTRLRDARDT